MMKSEQKFSGRQWLCVIIKSKIFSGKSHPENVGKRICGTLDFKIFLGCLTSDTPRLDRALGARILPPPEIITLTTPLQIYFTNLLFHAAIELIRVTGGEWHHQTRKFDFNLTLRINLTRNISFEQFLAKWNTKPRRLVVFQWSMCTLYTFYL